MWYHVDVMYISRKQKNRNYVRKGQFDFSHRKAAEEIEREKEKTESLPPPEDMLIEKHSRDVLFSWRSPEFEMFERDKKWYLYVTLILLAIVAYAVLTNGLVMAITFILVGVVGYIYIHKEPRVLDFMITEDGVVAGREIYDFNNLKSFWIFYEPEGVKVISLHTESHLVPYVHIPIHNEDPLEIREILLGYIPEEKHEPGIIETLYRLLKL